MAAPAWTAERLLDLPTSFAGSAEGGRAPDKWKEESFEVIGGPPGARLRLTVRHNLWGFDRREVWRLDGRVIGFSAEDAAAALNAPSHSSHLPEAA